MNAAGPVVVGFSGPDGSGKSSLSEAVARLAATRGAPAVRTYLYGCVACRHVRLPPVLRRALSGRGTLSLEAGQEPEGRSPTTVQRVHALVDAADLALRLDLGLRRARRQARRTGGPVLVLADRTPLDSMVKHDLPTGCSAVRLLRGQTARFACIALLDARSELLSQRDREHRPPGLELTRQAYRRWSADLPAVARLSSEDQPPERLAVLLLEELLPRGASAGAAPQGPPAPPPGRLSSSA